MFSDCNHMILLSLLSRNTRSAIFRFTPCRTTSRTPALTHTLYRSMPKQWTFHIVCSDCDSRAQHHTPCEHSCKCDWYFAHFFLPLFTRAKRILSHSSVKFNVQKQQMIGLIERQLGRVSCSACVVKRSPPRCTYTSAFNRFFPQLVRNFPGGFLRSLCTAVRIKMSFDVNAFVSSTICN